MITWIETIEFIMELFDVTQAEVAKRLGISPSQLSKIKSGTQAPTFTNEELYGAIFDLENSESFAEKIYNCNIEDVKNTIEELFPQIRQELEDCWESDDYKKFLYSLLRRTKRASSQKGRTTTGTTKVKIACRDTSESDSEQMNDNANETLQDDTRQAVKLVDDETIEPQSIAPEISVDETPTNRMIRVFEQAVADHHIVPMLRDLADHIGSGAFYAGDASAFIAAVREDLSSGFVHLQNEEKFRQIFEFTGALNAYVRYLGMLPPQDYVVSENNLEDSEISDHLSPWLLPYKYYADSEDNIEYNSPGIEDVSETESDVVIDWEAYRHLWRTEFSYPMIYKRISSDRKQLQDLGVKVRNAEETKIHLDFLEMTFLNHEKVCRLFSEITGGKKLVMYYP